jgi:hypothetical protein
MKRLTLLLLGALLPLVQGIGLVIETSSIDHAFTYLEKDTLYVFDLDNTLIESVQHLGSDQWVAHELNQRTSQGQSLDDALCHVIPYWIEVQNRTEMRLVDPAIPNLLMKMQKKNVAMIGLTKRPPELSDRTLQQMKPLNIDFSKTAHHKEELIFSELSGTQFKQGIIFVSQGVDKGPCLLAYLKTLKKIPKRIVVIDDKMSNVKNIADAIEPLGIPFIGIRYGAADEKVKAYNPEIAELQREHFQKILSDEEALHLLKLKTQSLTTSP